MDTTEKDLDTSVFKWKTFSRQLFVSSITWVFYFMFGLSIGTPTVTIPQLRKEANSTESVSTEMASWISSAIGYIGIIWVIGLTLIIHRFGCKITMMLLALNSFVAFLLLYCSKNAVHVLIFQILQGMTAASQTTISLMVLTEYTSPRYRGIFLTIKSATLFWGIWVSNAIGAFFNYRYIGLFGIICSVYTIVSVIIVPESPYWLASKERYVECAKSFRWLKDESDNTEKELEILINFAKSYKINRKYKKSFMDYVKVTTRNVSKPEVYKPVLLSMLLMAMYHFSGKLVCTVYSIQMIKKITNSDSTAYIGMLVLDGFTVLGMYVGCGFSKFLKRRTLLLTASTIGTLFLFSMSLYLYLIRFSVISENHYITIGLLTGFSLSICCGPMILSTTLFAELIPLRSRTFCFCIGSIFTKCLMGTLLKTSPNLFYYLGFDGTLTFFGTISTIIIILIYYYLPETKGKTLTEIADLYKTKPEPKELVILTENGSKH